MVQRVWQTALLGPCRAWGRSACDSRICQKTCWSSCWLWVSGQVTYPTTVLLKTGKVRMPPAGQCHEGWMERVWNHTVQRALDGCSWY